MTSRLPGTPWMGLLGWGRGRVGFEPCPRAAWAWRRGKEREEKKKKKKKKKKVSLAPPPLHMLPWPCTPPRRGKDPRGPQVGRKTCLGRVVGGGLGVLEGLLVWRGAVEEVLEGVVWALRWCWRK